MGGCVQRHNHRLIRTHMVSFTVPHTRSHTDASNEDEEKKKELTASIKPNIQNRISRLCICSAKADFSWLIASDFDSSHHLCLDFTSLRNMQITGYHSHLCRLEITIKSVLTHIHKFLLQLYWMWLSPCLYPNVRSANAWFPGSKDQAAHLLPVTGYEDRASQWQLCCSSGAVWSGTTVFKETMR